jgi:hypothetical protein
MRVCFDSCFVLRFRPAIAAASFALARSFACSFACLLACSSAFFVDGLTTFAVLADAAETTFTADAAAVFRFTSRFTPCVLLVFTPAFDTPGEEAD